MALNGLRADAVKWEAVSNQPNIFTAKSAKDAKKRFNFCLSFAVFASIAVDLWADY
jgi:hypothetical protein